jgi:hypothetical protein
LTHEIEVETSIFNRLFPEKGERMVMKRLFQIEAISSALMTSEELSAFCLSFEGYLEDLPKKLVGYKTEDINRFYKNVINADDQYFQDLWIFPNPDTFTEIEKYERSLIEKIQDQNIRFTRKLFNEITKFRQLYGKLYNKYKHSLPLFLSFGEPEHVSAELEKDKECLEIVVVFDDPNNLLRKPRIFILGEHAVKRAFTLQMYMSHFLEAMLRRRLNWARFGGKRLPPTVVYGKNPLKRQEWELYQITVKSLLPTPIKSWPIKPKHISMRGSVVEMHRWIHSNMWEQYFEAEPERFFYDKE